MNAESTAEQDGNIPRLRTLKEEHGRYARQLETLSSKPYPSEDEKVEMVRLKKMKLHLKDQISVLQGRSGDAVTH